MQLMMYEKIKAYISQPDGNGAPNRACMHTHAHGTDARAAGFTGYFVAAATSKTMACVIAYPHGMLLPVAC